MNPRGGIREVLAAVDRQFDVVLAAGLLVAATGFTTLLSSPTPVAIDLVDQSWAFDLLVKSQRHEWLGGKVMFTYGPLFQLGSSALARLLGGSFGAFSRSWYVFPFWAAIVSTFLVGRILLGGHSVWKRSFYLLALIGFWTAIDARFSFDIFMFAFSLRYFDRARQLQRVPPWSTVTMALLLLSGFLISADAGVYSLAGFVIAGAAHVCVFWPERQIRAALMRAAIVSGASLALLMLATGLVMARYGFDYWADVAAVVGNYRWSLAHPMEKVVKARLIATTVVSLLTLAIAWRWRNPTATSLARRPVFFPAAMAFSLLMLQSGLVRADWWHVQLALLPAVALAGAVLMGGEIGASDWRAHLPMAAALALTAFFTGPTDMLIPRYIVANLRLGSVTRSQNCPKGTRYFDEACMPPSDFGALRAVSDYLRNETSASEPVAIFPYENLYADMARRSVAGGVLQNYMVLGDRMVQRQLQGLRRDNPRIAILSVEGVATWPLEDVPNFTRTPDIWFYLQNNFVRQRELTPGILALERDPLRAQRINFEASPLSGGMESPIRHRVPIDVPLASSPDQTDFLRIRLRVAYSLWWTLRKPSFFNVTVVHSDGTAESFQALVKPNTTSDIWIYPWDDHQLADYFDASEAQWRKGRPRAPVSSLQFSFQRMDDVSVVPSRLEIESVEAVRLRLDDAAGSVR